MPVGTEGAGDHNLPCLKPWITSQYYSSSLQKQPVKDKWVYECECKEHHLGPEAKRCPVHLPFQLTDLSTQVTNLYHAFSNVLHVHRGKFTLVLTVLGWNFIDHLQASGQAVEMNYKWIMIIMTYEWITNWMNDKLLVVVVVKCVSRQVRMNSGQVWELSPSLPPLFSQRAMQKAYLYAISLSEYKLHLILCTFHFYFLV